QSVLITVADAADPGLDPGLGKSFGVLEGHALRPAVAVMNQAAAMNGPATTKRLFQRIQHEAGIRGSAGAPTDDPPGVSVDDEGDVDEPRPGRDMSEVRHPEPVRRRRMELAVDVIERA